MKQNQVIEPALELAFGPILIWGLPPDLCSGSLSVLAIPVGHLSRVFLSRIVYVGIMKPEEQLLATVTLLGRKEFYYILRVKTTRSDERVNTRYERKGGNKKSLQFESGQLQDTMS